MDGLRIGPQAQTDGTAATRGILAGKSGGERLNSVNYMYNLSRSGFSLLFTQNYAFSTHMDSVGVLGSAHAELVTVDTFVPGSFTLGI